MTRNPILNALAASGYIILVALTMFYGIEHAAPNNSIVVPIVVLSLFSLSAAVMGYIFFYHPILLFLDGKKKAAVDLFLRTVASFAVITLVIAALFFSRIIG